MTAEERLAHAILQALEMSNPLSVRKAELLSRISAVRSLALGAIGEKPPIPEVRYGTIPVNQDQARATDLVMRSGARTGFFASLRAGVEAYGTLTPRQVAAVLRSSLAYDAFVATHGPDDDVITFEQWQMQGFPAERSG